MTTDKPGRSAVCVAATVLASLSAGAVSAQWPSFRGPNASGVGDGLNVPARWNAAEERGVKWKVPVAGLGHSSPIVWGNRVFLTTAISEQSGRFEATATGGRSTVAGESEHEWRVMAFDLQTGKTLWTQTAHRGRPRLGRHVRSSHANATPATDGRYVVAFFGSEGLFVYDVEGNLRWRRNLGVLDAGYVGLPDYQWETASSPLIYRDLVIVQCDSRADSFMAAFDLADGKEVWRQERDENPSWATPVVARAGDRDLIVTSSPRFFRATDPLTGEEVWRVADDADVKVPTPVSGHGLVVFSGGAPQGRPFIAVRLDVPPDAPSAEGAPDRVAWRVEKGSPYTPTPILYGDYLYVLSDNGILSCYEARTGREVYRQRVPDVGGTYTASPVVADGRLYLSHADGTVYVVRAGPTFELIATNPMGEVLMATPAMAPGILLIRTQSHLVALTGTPPGDLPG